MNSPPASRQLRLLNRAMIETGWTTERLAVHFGIPAYALAQWLSGEVKTPPRWQRIEFLISLPINLAERWVHALLTERSM
jgi:hypothetical protein